MDYKDTSSHEFKNICVIAKKTSQIMKYRQDVIVQNGQM